MPTAWNFCLLLIGVLFTQSAIGQSKISTNFENPFSKLNNQDLWSSFKDKGVRHLQSEYDAKADLFSEKGLTGIDVDIPGDSLVGLYQRGKRLGKHMEFDSARLPDSARLVNRLPADTLIMEDSLAVGLYADSLSEMISKYEPDSAKIDSLLNSSIDSGRYAVEVDTARLLSTLNEELDTVQLPRQPDHELLANFRKESFLNEYTDHFEAYKGVIKQSQSQVEKYKKREDFKSFIKEFFSNKLSNSDSSDSFKRFEMGTFIEIKQSPFHLECNPSVKYNLTNKFSLGVGYSFAFHFDPIKIQEVFFRSYTQYSFRKYFVHFEAESRESLQRNGESFQMIPRRYNYAIGLGRGIRLGKLNGSLLLLYHFNETANNKISIRYGINLFKS